MKLACLAIGIGLCLCAAFGWVPFAGVSLGWLGLAFGLASLWPWER